MGGPSVEIPVPEQASERRLDSWKEIATYLNRDVTTVQRWERREQMPVHRHLHDKRGSVYALTAELDAWRESRNRESRETDEASPQKTALSSAAGDVANPRRTQFWLGVTGLFLAGLGLSSYLVVRNPAREAAPSQIRSIAVLPLRNLSGDASQEYLAEGLTEALIGRLSGIHNLHVVSHTSVMRYRNPQISVPEIAKSLGVDAVVEGSVIRQGTRIRVTAQLIRGATDEHFWSETYDREMTDALTLESQLARSIAAKIEVTVTGEEKHRLIATRSVAPEVYESYLKGTFLLEKAHGRSQIEESVGYFDDAIRKDATFAPAYVNLAEAYTMLGTVAAGDPPFETRPKAINAARKALELDPDIAEAHVLLANLLQEQWHWPEAETEYRSALDLNPNDADAHAKFALWLSCEGRTDEALASIKRARELDPIAVSGGSIAWILFQSHRFDEALREARSDVAARPGDPGALLVLGFVLTANQQPKEAIPLLQKSISISNGGPAATGVLIRAYARAGRRNDALRLLAELHKRRNAGYIPAAAFVNAYLGLGDDDQTFVWLERARQEQSNILQFVKTHPYFDPIRSDPRFAQLIHRVGLG